MHYQLFLLLGCTPVQLFVFGSPIIYAIILDASLSALEKAATTQAILYPRVSFARIDPKPLTLQTCGLCNIEVQHELVRRLAFHMDPPLQSFAFTFQLINPTITITRQPPRNGRSRYQ